MERTDYNQKVFVPGCADDGHVYTIDVNKEFVDVGREYWDKAGVAGKITSILKPADEVVKEMAQKPEHLGSFDIAYLDVPKHLYEPVSVARNSHLLRYNSRMSLPFFAA